MGFGGIGLKRVLFACAVVSSATSILAFGYPALAAALSGVVAVVMVLVTVLGVQRALDTETVSLRDDVANAQSQFKHVVENLPVGLFTFHGGRFAFSNWAWDEQVMRMPGQVPCRAFEGALHPDDRERVAKAFAGYEQREEPFQFRFRLRDEFGGVRYIESYGVPVYDGEGTFMHLLGFNLDVTMAEKSARELDTKNHALEIANSELEENLEAMVASLVKAIEAKDPYTGGHSERVMEYSVRIGQAYGLSKEDLRVLRMGTLIHDIGKIGIPDDVLTKPGKLTDEEFETIKRHSAIGFNMIREIPFFKACAPIVRWHHEKLNGRGYPDGLHGEEIPLLVQISTIADMFDAMTSNRAYRRSLGIDVAVSELRKDAKNNGVNSELVELWVRLLSEDGLYREETDEGDYGLPLAA